MSHFGTTLSNLIKNQFPSHHREYGPLFVSFVEHYYRWLEEQTESRDDWFPEKTYLVNVTNKSANVVGLGSIFTTQFANGDSIAISRGADTQNYDIFRVKTVVDDTHLTLTPDKIPDFNHANTKYATVSIKPNALYLTRNFPNLKDIDETLDDFVVYFKEKYLKDLQFRTITDTKTLVKHSLDLYRSKGTERSIDLLYKIAFGKPAKVYYPGRDLFKLSSGEWYIPRYLELSLSPANKSLVNKQIVGLLSGATAFIEEVIRRAIDSKVLDIAYISAVNGEFRTGEKINLSDNSLDVHEAPTIVGSLTNLLFDISGSGGNFEVGDIVTIESAFGRGAIGKVLGTSNTTGQIAFALNDGGYGYTANVQHFIITGNVAVNTTSAVVTGNGTTFQTQFSNGDYISVYANGTFKETHQVTAVTSNTSLTTNANFTFANGDTYAYHTRYFAQTFISEKILTLANVTISSSYLNPEYAPFLDLITQPTAFINYESSTGQFASGDHIFTYHANNDLKGEAYVMTVSKKTLSSGILTISILSGNLQGTAFYTTANAVQATQTISNGYFDTTATANVIGNYANVTITVTNVVGTFQEDEIITQPVSQSIGVIQSVFQSGSNAIISILNSEGVFKNGFSVGGQVSGAQGTVDKTSLEFGVIDVSNTFVTLTGNRVYTNDLQGTITGVSTGSGGSVTFGNSLIYTEAVSFNTDYIYPSLTFDIGAAAYTFFEGMPTANLSTSIGDALSFAELTIGKVEEIIATSPGIDYNKIPIIRLYESTFHNFELPDKIALTVTSTSGFQANEVITQTATSGRGLIQEITNTTSMVVQDLRFYSNNDFVATTNATTTIVGSESGTEANITAIAIREMSSNYGLDATTRGTLTISTGAVIAIQVTDSGFGFTNNELVTITNDEGLTANGFAILETAGSGSGYYRTNDGFLSDVKKLSDGFYWQEYSYEVQSAVIDDFKKILKKIVHVAGTKAFDALVYDTVNDINTEANITNTIVTLIDRDLLWGAENGLDWDIKDLNWGDYATTPVYWSTETLEWGSNNYLSWSKPFLT